MEGLPDTTVDDADVVIICELADLSSEQIGLSSMSSEDTS